MFMVIPLFPLSSSFEDRFLELKLTSALEVILNPTKSDL